MKTKKLSKTKIKNGIFNAVIYILLLLLAVIMLYPLIFVLSASFSDPKAVAGGEMLLLPVKPSLEGYRYLMQYKEIWVGYGNTIFYMIAGTLLNLAATLPCAYAMSRKDLKGRKYLMIYFMITMYFSGGMIPGYLNIKSLGLLDTRGVILINGLVSTFNLIVARTYFMTSIPWEIQEAAVIDGCNDFQIFGKIIFPLSKAITVVMTLYYGVGRWNSYFVEMIYLKDRNKFPLQLFLREILTKSTFAKTAMADGMSFSAEQMMALIKQADTANMIKYGVIVLSALPMLIIYPFLQKYFEQGVMIGSVKG
ncbi:sugar ABC transporter permease [Eisenbergiella tayi]|uniref:Inner membrane ABC transporter permease protein YcjP n=1 Tax=Eisenbergiella tayi TaxID=1432052 RepID=A0A1E3AHT1_9FIRM|nr:carbohydrate ABC transporter permease [Eisenbergiella tayi]ODM07961.1 Inner membrane ABC transporter permease protein YcjP [Eisenbergiella tayi]OIZ64014.1 sugar ABC transporter permease [Eisenbergiella tayi]